MKDELLSRLESFEIDQAGARFPFSARLAKENGWSRSFARRVTGEYKRFIWLAMRAGHPVTPSQEIDEAWHLHLCYTRSYWDGMCADILGKPLHHGPTEGGPAEDEKFAGWYDRTLESYRRHFGEEPPADIWPPAARRFQPVATRKVDSRCHWIVPKRAVRGGLAGAAVIAGASALAGCTGIIGAVDLSGLVCFIVPGLFLVALVIGARRIAARGGSNRQGCGGSTGCGSSGCGSARHDHDGGGGSDDSGSGSDGGSSGCGGGGCGGGGD